ncbi:hypothetical protein EYF80_047084 [Liparis tanakae]|uniref:Uncharacterized protein n=1 Tax=Liparis tanakae TaxID=230148 RepID=A0A4Z2FPM7_9TELE|nr:hypothetical protein EYF80_047084 [Liparis tanakae]
MVTFDLTAEPRGLVGGAGSVLLPWLLKPDVAVEDGEKPPLTRAEQRRQQQQQQRRREELSLGKKTAKPDEEIPVVIFNTRAE